MQQQQQQQVAFNPGPQQGMVVMPAQQVYSVFTSCRIAALMSAIIIY